MTLSLLSKKPKIKPIPGGVRIVIPGRIKVRDFLLLSIWVCLCLCLLYIALVIGFPKIFINLGDFSFAFIVRLFAIPVFVIPVVFLSITGGWAAYLLLWQIGGVERIEASPSFLKIKKSLFGIGRTRMYASEEITVINLGKEQLFEIPFGRYKFMQVEVPETGPIIFGVKGKKHGISNYLGMGLKPQEAEKIVGILREQIFSGQVK